MIIDKYSFRQTEVYTEEVLTTLTELNKDMPHLSKQTIKEWVLSGATITGGKIKLYKKQ